MEGRCVGRHGLAFMAGMPGGHGVRDDDLCTEIRLIGRRGILDFRFNIANFRFPIPTVAH